MNIKLRKSIALVSALTLATMTSSALNVFAVDTSSDDEELEYTQFPFVRECEDPEISNGNETWTNIYGKEFPDYSGDGFVYLTGTSMKFDITVPEDDMYEIKVRYTQVLSETNDSRMQTISVNGTEYMVAFPYADTWTDISFGIFRLKAGVNTIEITPQYGYASYDTITVDKANLTALDVTPTLSDKSATSETQSLMNYLCDVYGNGILSGQQEIYGGGNDGNYELEFEYIEELTGELPAIRGFDFMNYNPLYGWDDGTTERIIEWVNDRNGIATACWHINVPQDFTSYELGDSLDWTSCTYVPDSTNFDTSNAVIEGTKEYDYFMLAIANLAEQIQKLQDANVPIILRPLHEAEGNSNTDGSGSWFWWGSAGAETYKELWKLLYTTLTEDYGLHNIIWEYNSYDYTTSDQWYPGDDYVDIVGYDKYNTVYNRHDGLTGGPNVDAISSTFYSLVNLTNGKKLVSMPENDTVPTIENMQIEKAGWLYFCPWYGEHLMDSSKNDPETLKAIYQDDYCINLADLPANLYSYESQKSGSTTTEPSETTTEATTTTTETEVETTTTTEDTTAVADTSVESAIVRSLEGNNLTVEFIYRDYATQTVSYELTDEEVAKYPTDLSNTYVIVEAPLIEGTTDYDWENPIHIDLEVKEYGYVTARDDDTVTATLDSGKVFTFDSSATTAEVDDYVMVAYNERTEEAQWIELMKKAQITNTGTIIEITDTTIIVQFSEYTSSELTIPEDFENTFAVGDEVEVTYLNNDDYLIKSMNLIETETTTTPIETEVTTVTTSDTTGSSEGTTTVTSTAIDIGNSDDVVLGDADSDGSVQANDVLLVKKYLLKMIDDDEINLTNADVTQNGSVEANDLLLIKKYILQMIDSL